MNSTKDSVLYVIKDTINVSDSNKSNITYIINITYWSTNFHRDGIIIINMNYYIHIYIIIIIFNNTIL